MLLEYGDAYTTIKHETVLKEVKELRGKLKSGNEDLSQACVREFDKLKREGLKRKSLLWSGQNNHNGKKTYQESTSKKQQ